MCAPCQGFAGAVSVSSALGEWGKVPVDDSIRVHTDRKGGSTSTDGGVEAIRTQFSQPDHPGANAEPHKEALAGTDKFRTAVRSAVSADVSRRGGSQTATAHRSARKSSRIATRQRRRKARCGRRHQMYFEAEAAEQSSSVCRLDDIGPLQIWTATELRRL